MHSMSRGRPLILLLLAMLAAPVAAPAALAQEKLPATVAVVVDYARILRDAKVDKAIRTQIDARRKVYQDQIAK